MIEILLNDKKMKMAENSSLTAALKTWQYEIGTIAVAINERFVHQSQYKDVILKANDRVEILSPMQGG